MSTLTEQTTTQLTQEARNLGLIGEEIVDYIRSCKEDGTFDQLLRDKQRELELEETRQKRNEASEKIGQLKVK